MFGIDIEILKNVAQEHGTPIFVTFKEILHNRTAALRNAFAQLNMEIFYAIKANYNDEIISELKKAGITGLDTVSINEVEFAKKLGFKDNEIMFTGNNLDINEIEMAHNYNIQMNLGSISELRKFCSKFHHSAVGIRVNPGFGDGEFSNVITGGATSKFGILENDIDQAINILKTANVRLNGLHCHIGSGLYDTEKFQQMVRYLFSLIQKYNLNLDFLDLGGGFGVRYGENTHEINLKEFADVILEERKRAFANTNVANTNKNMRFIIEPGKFLVAESTVFLFKVTNISENRLNQNNKIKIVGTNTGMNHMIRTALYGAKHHVINISNPDGEKEYVKLVGNICESTDVFDENIQLAKVKEGDILAMYTTGAYCSSMSSMYNLRPYAKEIVI